VRPPKDRDFVETAEGLFFCVVGYVHPPGRYAAYLKYTPASAGKWARGPVAYRRELPYYHVRHVLRTLDFLEREHPRYVWRDPATGVRFSGVPRAAVATYYAPEGRLASLRAGPRDPLEEEVRTLAELLLATGGLPPEVLGVTGSVLLGLHNPTFSDIDLTVYGAGPTRRVREALGRLSGGPVQPLPADRRERWRADTTERFGLSAGDVAHLESRRWNYFLFGDRYVSVHPTRAEAEMTERYGDRRWTPAGPAVVEARVTDATASLYLPAVYGVAPLAFREGRPGPLAEVVSYEALYCGVADEGERVLASGHLERDEATGVARLIVGAAADPAGGFLRILPR
jgi:hypothetical protein